MWVLNKNSVDKVQSLYRAYRKFPPEIHWVSHGYSAMGLFAIRSLSFFLLFDDIRKREREMGEKKEKERPDDNEKMWRKNFLCAEKRRLENLYQFSIQEREEIISTARRNNNLHQSF